MAPFSDVSVRVTPTQQLRSPHTAKSARFWCLVGLAVALVGSISALILGGFVYKRQQVIYNYRTESYDQTPLGLESTTSKEVISLLLNVYVTLITECLDFIHSASLRWALHNEGRLTFNSNLRLFTSAKQSYANGRIANFVWAVTLALSYTSVSQILLPNSPNSTFRSYIWCPSPLVILGVSLLCQALLATWCLIPSKQRNILSWDSSPLNTTLAYLHRNGRRFHAHQCVAIPSSRQRNAYRAVPNVRRIVIFLWVLVRGEAEKPKSQLTTSM